MINRISEIPFWGPEEQIRRFINQHDEMSELYEYTLGRLGFSDEVIASLTTEEAKKNKLKEYIVGLFVEPTVSDGKFILDGNEYVLADLTTYWTFDIGNAEYEYDRDNSQVTWIDPSMRRNTVNIRDNKFIIGDVEYTIDASQVTWSEGETSMSTTINDTFRLPNGIEYIKSSDNKVKLSLIGKTLYFNKHVGEYLFPQQTITQQRIENLDEIYQKQLIWSYGLNNVDDAYFYQDWCPIGDHTEGTEYNPNPKW